MHLLVNLVLCLVAAAVIATGTAAALFVVAESAPRKPAPVQQKAPAVGPRVQAWLDRKAEELAFAEKEKAAALAEQERAQALRVEIPPPPAQTATTPLPNVEDQQAARLERARRAKQLAKQEAKRRLRQQAEAQRAYGYAPERPWSAYPTEFLTRRDRAGL
jgi:hypothetical protein